MDLSPRGTRVSSARMLDSDALAQSRPGTLPVVVVSLRYSGGLTVLRGFRCMQTKNELMVQGSTVSLGMSPSLGLAREMLAFAVPHNADQGGRNLSKREQD